MSIVRRSLTSISWNIVANSTKIVVLFGRSILLARWLPVEVFGIYTAAYSIVVITKTIPSFGMDGAFIHRAEEVQDEQLASAIHFTLKLIFTMMWAVVMIGVAFTFVEAQTQFPVLVILGTEVIAHLIETPRLILRRRIVHRRMAFLEIAIACASTITSLILAWFALKWQNNWLGLWALLSSHLIIVSFNFFWMYIWRPVWRPQLAWKWNTVRYFVSFGSKNFISLVLLQIIDRLDDLWTKVALGDTALGFYSHAYSFATYPREVLARPVNTVMEGTYAELKGNRQELSLAFGQSNALLIRSGFFLGGLLFLIAPEWISLLLTDKWLPMLNAFRLMLVFTLLDPIRMTAASLLVGVGEAQRPIPIRVFQLLVMAIGLFLFAPRWGIEGVAIVVNVVLVIGLVLLFWQARPYVDYSLRQLFMVPLLALMISLLGTFMLLWAIELPDSAWWTGGIKLITFSPIYLLFLVLCEGKQTLSLISGLRQLRSDNSRKQTE